MIYRKKKETGFTQVDNSVLRREELSLSAKGLLCYMLSFPDNWKFTIPDIEKGTGTKRTKIMTMVSELEKGGYIVRTRCRYGGKFAVFIDVHEEPNQTPIKIKLSDIKKREMPHKTENGYLYVIKMGEHYKIGVSIEPTKRLKEFTMLPNEMEIVVNEKKTNYQDIEKELHEIYKGKRVRGEWFSLDEKDIEDIRDYLSKK